MRSKIPLLLVLFSVPVISLAQTTQIKGFLNINANYISDTSETEADRSQFILGQYDFFVTSQISENFSMLGESVFEYDGDFGVDVERLFAKYTASNHFAISAGKFHTPLGYWNNAFHHGLVIQPIMVRPDVLKFEDDGGILPIHETGVQFDAENFSKLNLGFNLLISNGLQSTPISDFNIGKAVTLNVHAEPIDNLVFTVSGYWNQAPGPIAPETFWMNPQDIPVTHAVKTLIVNGAVAYMHSPLPVEFIGEYYSINHDEDSIGSKITNAVLIYAGYKIKKFTIYGCFENISYPNGIQYYIKNNTTSILGGIRYKPAPLVVLKLQYRNYKTEAPTIADDGITGPQNIFEAQFAIGF